MVECFLQPLMTRLFRGISDYIHDGEGVWYESFDGDLHFYDGDEDAQWHSKTGYCNLR